WLHLQAPVLYYLRAGLWLIGIAGFVGYFFLRPGQRTDAPAGAAADIDYTFAEAANRMQAAQGIKQLNNLPAVFLLGDSGSAKTSILAKSGLEPELLAGAAYQDYVVTPTRVLNVWYSHRTLFIDPAGHVIEDGASRRKLFKKFAPRRLNSAFSSKLPPIRSVVFTVDTETFLRSGAAEALAAKSRQFHTVLTELSAELGSSFPVYVLFTKADKITYFRDFAENLTDPEASDIFGITLPMEPAGNGGVYAEAQTRRLTNAFQELYYSLSDRRPSYLGREHDSAKLPNVYEFPREFAKLRPLLVPFLVDLCRPSQLGITPFLRGFYFTGVRPLTIADLAPAAQASLIEEQDIDAGATRIFNPRSNEPFGPVQGQAGGASSRRVPQWVFLGHLFPNVILSDQPATTMAQRNVKVNLARRILLGAAAALALFMAGWWSVSYSNNRALVGNAVEAARAIPSAGLPSGQLASLDSLRRLTRVRDTLDTLNRYDREGVPFNYGAFLYAGHAIRQPLRVTYYALFRKLLLAPTQETLVGICTKPEQYESQGYSYLYNSLKAYLITTDHHEKSTVDFLAPVLLQHWPNGQQVDNDRQDLARRNFEFYADELRDANPFGRYAKPDAIAVENARTFLKRSKQEDRIYQALLAEAGRGQKPIIFNSDYPGSAETVINTYRVDGAFTKNGSAMFAKELEDPARYFSGEDWVLGEAINAAQDRQKLKMDLTEHYGRDLTKKWREYLNATSVVPFGSVPDAANKLAKLSSPQSPLLQVLCVASENTKAAAQSFQPVQFVTPPPCSDKLVNSANNTYMQGLISLKTSLQAVGPIANADPNNLNAANASATQAENTVSNLALSFTPDPADPKSNVLSKTTQILREPITRVPVLLKAGVGAAANAAAADLCKSIRPMLDEYPFNSQSRVDATLQDVNSFLKPQDGRLWQLYNSQLKQYLIPAGNDYVRASGQQAAVTDTFLRFFNRAAHMSQAMYKGDAQQPSMSFSMQPLPSPDVTHVTLSINGQTLSTDLKTGARSQTFAWPGTAATAYLGVSFGNGPEFAIAQSNGLWAIWHLLDTGEHLPQSSGQLEWQWTQKTSAGVTTINGHPATVKFALDSQSSQIFRPQYFSSLGCASKAVQ
ncbi:MAG: ImcF-related family protein, partial [Bryobacteraceae bacterium]